MPPFVARSRRDVWVHLMLYPGHTLPTAASPIFVGVGLAIHDGVFAPWPALAAFVCSWLVHVGGVFVDQYQLLARHPGLGEHPELDDAVSEGWLKLPALRLISIAWFVAALVPGIYLWFVLGPPALLLGAIGIASAAWYHAGRPSMAELGLADISFFIMFGVVAVAATYYVQAVACGASDVLPLRALVIGLPAAGLVVNVLIIDDIRDVDFDRIKGWKTTPVRFGVAWSRREHLVLTVFGYLGPVALVGWYGPWMLLPLVTLPFAVAAEIAVWTAPRRELLIPWTPRSAFIGAAHAALFGVALALA